MEYNEFTWERASPAGGAASFSTTDVEKMTKLLAELRELTQSRRTHADATEFLRRFGCEVASDSVVMPETLAN